MLTRPLLAVVALAALTGATLLAPGCRTDGAPARGDTPPAVTRALKQKLRLALLHLEPHEGEPFADFLERARASCAADEDDELGRVARFLPDDPTMMLGGFSGEVAPILVGVWARLSSRQARAEALRSLITHRTINPRDVEVPGRTPAFDAFEADLKARAEAQGLTFAHVDHVAYEIAVPGGGDDARQRVGVLVHGDVVPAEEPGWTVPPFDGVTKDGAIYGRGAMDDKGPLVATLFALSALRNAGPPLLKTPVLIIGTSEETHWEGIDRYQKARPLPAALFVADGAFPVGVGEKGVATVRLTSAPSTALPATSNVDEARLVSIEGGEVSNQVPATATARVIPSATKGALLAEVRSRAEKMDGMQIVVREEAGALLVEATGKAAHGASPADGHNALSDLIRFLVQRVQLVRTPCVALLEVVDERLGTSHAGDKLGLADAHERFTPSTINLGTARTAEDGSCTLALNLRWPPPRSADDVVTSVGDTVRAALQQAPGGPFEVEVKGGGLDPFLLDSSAPWISRLTDAYALVTGEGTEPVTLSGTTYAKAAPGSVTFGPGRPGDHDRIHGADEHITLEELDTLTELYAASLLSLTSR
jgi:succinyl-diaminopimelate desuccinylase